MKHTNHIVLLVEDDPDDFLLITEALANSPVLVDIVHKKNGLEALNYLNEVKKNKVPFPCLIILDINMPLINGKQLIAILRNDESFLSIPIVVFTTSSSDGDKEYCDRFNVPMVTKPNGMDDFNEAVIKFLDHCN